MLHTGRIHAGERQLPGHVERRANPDDVRLVEVGERRRDLERVVDAKRQRMAHRREELRGRIRKRVAGERSDRDPRNAVQRAVDGGLRQEQHVPPDEIDVAVRGVVRRRGAAQRPVRGRIYIRDRQLEARELTHAASEGGRGQEPGDPRLLRPFPREAGADVHGLHGAAPGLVRHQHGAVESARAEDCRHAALTVVRTLHYHRFQSR